MSKWRTYQHGVCVDSDHSCLDAPRQRNLRLGLGWIILFVLAGCYNTTSGPAGQVTPVLSTPTPSDGRASTVSTAVALSDAGSPGIGDPYYDQLGNGGYDVSHYTITLDVDPASNTISGTAVIEAKATQLLASMNLDLQDLTVDAVQVNSELNKIDQPPTDDLYSWEQYGGGALTFHALRLKVGDEAFFKILRTYLERYRYGNASTQDFIDLSEEISGQELSAFFDAWLLGTQAPDFPEPQK